MFNPIDTSVPTTKPALPPELVKGETLILYLKNWELIIVLACIVTLVVMVPRAVQQPVTLMMNCQDGKTVTIPSDVTDPAKMLEYCDVT